MTTPLPLPDDGSRLVEKIEAGSTEERELRGLWLSRLMFGWMVGMDEGRGYEEWLAALGRRL